MAEVVSINSTEHYNWGNNCDGWHLLKNNDLSIIQEEVPPGESEVRHHHQYAKQFFFVLEGTATMELEGEIHQIYKNEGIFIAAGVKHKLSNQSDSPIKFIVVSSPKSHGDRIIAKEE